MGVGPDCGLRYRESARVSKSLPGRSYKLGSEFPAEWFVQKAVENYFGERGFHLDVTGHVDLICVHRNTGERWHIEVKGLTSQPGLDFRTCLGQLLQRMESQSTRHAIAVPDIPKYITQIGKVSHWVVNRLGIHWLLVAEDGSIRVVNPNS